MATAELQRLTDYSVNMDNADQMEVRSEKLAPIVKDKYRYTFRLDTSSFLDKNTTLLFKLKNKDGTASAKEQRVNCFNGALGAIRRVTLQIGDFEIQSIDSVGRWATLNNLYNQPPGVRQKKHSHFLGNDLSFGVRESQGNHATTLTGTIKPSTNSGINYGSSVDGTSAVINNHQLSENVDDCHQFGIPLGMLFPVLAQRDLPLFLFTTYKVHLIVEFENDASTYVNSLDTKASTFAAAAGDVLPDNDSVELLVDYLVFPSKVQEGIRSQTQSQGGYVMDFMNIETILKTIPAATANANQRTEHRLNLVNQELHYVQMCKQLPSGVAALVDKVLLAQKANGISLENINYNINGVDIYNAGPVSNPVELYNNMSYVLGRDLQVVKPLYVNDPNTEGAMITSPHDGLQGKYKPLGLDLRNGEPTVRGGGRVLGNYPVRVIYERRPHGAVTASTLEDTPVIATAENGVLDVQYFCAVTRVVKVLALPNGGMSVIVSDL